MMKTALLIFGLVTTSLAQAANVYDCQFLAINWSKDNFGEVISKVHPAPFNILKGEEVKASLEGFDGSCGPVIAEGATKGPLQSLNEITKTALVCSFTPSDGSQGGAAAFSNEDLVLLVPKSKEPISLVASCVPQEKSK